MDKETKSGLLSGLVAIVLGLSTAGLIMNDKRLDKEYETKTQQKNYTTSQTSQPDYQEK